ncbi:MAG: cupin domain-containing protein [Treponema sp.]|jgi:mannose-6-phosphate isomerase-like protein (cupin superfamily)|nr:cupin domain-containing protein [Treponema sp.]
MVVQRSEMKIEKKEKLRDGEGAVTFTHFVDSGADSGAERHVRLAAELTLPPGASIGYHQHTTETEYFVFLEGTGIVNDNGAEVPIKKGDLMITGNGAYHSVKNTGSVPLVFNAFIITY